MNRTPVIPDDKLPRGPDTIHQGPTKEIKTMAYVNISLVYDGVHELWGRLMCTDLGMGNLKIDYNYSHLYKSVL